MSKDDPLYKQLAQLVGARARCDADDAKQEWFARHTERIHALVKEHMPSGSGFDNGTTIDLEWSTEEKLTFRTSYHHMDEDGSYDGWTDHVIVVRPSLAFNTTLKITGPNRNQIKDYMHEVFEQCLDSCPRPARNSQPDGTARPGEPSP